MREFEADEVRKRMEAAREREVAEAEACEDVETMQQMQSMGGHSDGQ